MLKRCYGGRLPLVKAAGAWSVVLSLGAIARALSGFERKGLGQRHTLGLLVATGGDWTRDRLHAMGLCGSPHVLQVWRRGGNAHAQVLGLP